MIATHPTDQELGNFLLGKLADAAVVESHLAECDSCRERAAAVQADDTFTELLAAARTRLDSIRASAPTPTLDGAATPPAFAPTLAWETPGADATGLAGIVPAPLADHPKYRPIRRLGVGGMGTVWLAEHRVMNRPVAVKVIRPDLLARPGATERFLREVRAAAKLHHPNIVTAFDADPAGDSCLFVMEYVPGETLAERLAAGPLPLVEALKAIRDAARGLAHAHSHGLVHRDVKPHNLIRMASPDALLAPGVVKVLDFGLAGVGAGEPIAAGGEGLTGAGMVVGTPDYIAPEQIADPHTADARADIYGLGCTLYHLLAGRSPMPDGSVMEKLTAQRTRPMDPIPGLPAAVAAVLAKMTAKDPADRYQSADEVVATLERCIRMVDPVRRRRRQLVAVAAGLLFAGLLIAAGVVIKIQRDNQEITITTDDPDIEVLMKRKGEVMRIIDRKTGKEWEYDTIKNEIAQADTPDGLTLALPDKQAIVLKRNGKEVFTVRRLPPATDQREAKIAAATRAADAYIKAIDAGDFGRVWDGAADWAKQKGANKATVVRDYESLANQSGKLNSRTPTRPQYLTILPGTPEGEYVLFGYNSRFERWDYVVEQLTLKLEPDGQWRPVGYQRQLASAPPTIGGDGFVSLFNGKDLTGWKSLYQATLTWADGVLTAKGRDVLLVTDRSDYANFHLRLSVKSAIDSGAWVRFRADAFRGDGYLTGIRPAGTANIHVGGGLTVMRDKKQTGLAPNLEVGPPDQWHTLEIIAVGSRIKTMVNGKAVADVTNPDNTWTRGNIALMLQGQGPHEVQFKNVEIKELPPNEPAWVQLFNGKDLTGWKSIVKSKNTWTWADGVLTTKGLGDLLVTDRTDYENFHLRLSIKGDSGASVRLRCADALYGDRYLTAIRPAGGGSNIQVGGGLTVFRNRKETGLAEHAVVGPADQWHTLEIIAVGNRFKTLVNGKPVADVTDPGHTRMRGSIALSLLAQTPQEVHFKNVEIKELPASTASSPNSDQAKLDAAAKVAEAWLKLMDEKDFGRCWQEAARVVRNGVPKDEFVRELETNLEPLGKLKSRTIVRRQAAGVLPVWGAGDYVLIECQTSYATGEYVELVTAMLDTGGQWRICGYQVEPRKGASADHELIQGTWRAVSGERDGDVKFTADELKQLTMTFAGDTATVTQPGVRHTGTFTLDQTRSPKHITITGSEEDKFRGNFGIYELTGDTLKICMSDAKMGRPTKFAARDGDKVFVNIVLKREAPARPDTELILGTWRGIAAEIDGKPMPQQIIDLMKPTLTFTPDKMFGKPEGTIPKAFLDLGVAQGMLPKQMATIVEKGAEGIYHLDPAKSPKGIDFTILGEVRKVAVGLYELDGDRLRLCLFIDPAKVDQRPKEFAAKEGDKRVVLTLRRLTREELVLAEVERLVDPAKEKGNALPVALVERNGVAAFRFGKWLLVFEGVACDSKGAELFGLSAFNYPLAGGRGEGKIEFGGGLKGPGPEIHQKWDGTANEIAVNNYRFQLIGKGTRLVFGSKAAYEATDQVQTIVIARDGSTRLEAPPKK